MLSTLLIMATATSLQPHISCARYVVEPGPEQGVANAALVTKASHHDTGPHDLGTVLASRTWRIIWAAPADSEHGVFFFKGARGSERLEDVWGGSDASRREAFRWATHTLHVPAPLARCFADLLVTGGA